MIYNDIINYGMGWNPVSDVASQKKQDVYRGEVSRVLLGEAVDKGDLLYPVITSLGTIAEWKQANANSASTMPALALALEDGTDGQRIKVLHKGYVFDRDFNYGTLATGTFNLTGNPTEGDRLVVGSDDNPFCFQFTAAKGTTAGAKIKATATLSTTGVGVDGDTFTINGVVFECSTDGTIGTTSDYIVDLQAGLTQTELETAIEDALDQAIADRALDISYVDFTSNNCVITLGGLMDSYTGLEQNDVVISESMTNANWNSATTFLGGVPAVTHWVASLTQATAKTLLTAQITAAIAQGLDITQAAWATDALVLTAGTSSHKGYKGNTIALYECGSAGTKDGGGNMTVGAAHFSGGVEGGELYASTSKGLLTLTKPTRYVVQSVGFALEADKFFFNPQPVRDESALTATCGAGAIGTAFTPRTYRKTLDDGTIVTEIHVDMTGLASVATANDVIGLAAGGVAKLAQYVTSVFGIVYRIEMICLETPAGGDDDINLVANSSGTLEYDGAGGTAYGVNGGDAVGGQMVVNNVQGLTANHYFYLTAGTGDTAAAYTAGMFIFRFYGHPVLS